MDAIFTLLASRCDDEGFTYADAADVQQWADACGLSLPDFLDRFGAAIAQKYQRGDLSFAFCDSLVNDLWAALIDRVNSEKNVRWPALFHEVYDAFDAGEFHRRADKSDDPIADFTNPLIAALVAKL